MASNIVTFGLGSVALVGIIMFVINKFFKSNTSDLLTNFLNKQQDKLITENKEITKKQDEIIIKINSADKLTEETKQKIENTIVNTNIKINDLIKSDTNIKQIQDSIDNNWNDI